MRVFVTGATGYIGSAVVDALQRASHQVVGLVRHQEKARRLSERGIDAAVGTLGNPSMWQQEAADCDAFIHTAFESSEKGADIDRIAVDALIDLARHAATRGPAVFVYTSGIWVLGSTDGPVDEQAPRRPADIVAWRPAQEDRVLSAAAPGLRTVVVRPGIVYGGSRGIVSDMLRDAENGLMRIIGTGENHWPLIYDRDLAELYARLVGSPEASGLYHANDEGDERVGDVATAIAEHRPHAPDIRYVPIAEARTKLGPLADALTLDQRVRSTRARSLGWSPALKSVSGNVARLFDELRRGKRAEEEAHRDQ